MIVFFFPTRLEKILILQKFLLQSFPCFESLPCMTALTIKFSAPAGPAEKKCWVEELCTARVLRYCTAISWLCYYNTTYRFYCHYVLARAISQHLGLAMPSLCIWFKFLRLYEWINPHELQFFGTRTVFIKSMWFQTFKCCIRQFIYTNMHLK